MGVSITVTYALRVLMKTFDAYRTSQVALIGRAITRQTLIRRQQLAAHFEVDVVVMARRTATLESDHFVLCI